MAKGSKAFLKKSLYILFIFIKGVINFLNSQRVIKPAKIELNLALVQNFQLDAPPTKIVVLGQLNSGNVYTYNILKNAFDLLINEKLFDFSFLVIF